MCRSGSWEECDAPNLHRSTSYDIVKRWLDTTIDHVVGSALVVGKPRSVFVANSAARAALNRDGEALLERVFTALRGDTAVADVDVHAMGDQSEHFLVIADAGDDRLEERASRAVRAWHLTKRQRHVLACMLRGYSNARIASELSVKERTVEAHITAIFERARCVSRAELISKVLFTR